jgi:hypothetical protein
LLTTIGGFYCSIKVQLSGGSLDKSAPAARLEEDLQSDDYAVTK